LRSKDRRAVRDGADALGRRPDIRKSNF
jgi:hypothetical protein